MRIDQRLTRITAITITGLACLSGVSNAETAGPEPVRAYFRCAGPTDSGNIQNGATGATGWSDAPPSDHLTEPHSALLQSGASNASVLPGCGYTEPPNTPGSSLLGHRVRWSGWFDGPIYDMTVLAYRTKTLAEHILPSSQSSAWPYITFRIDGVKLSFDSEPKSNVALVADDTEIPGIGLWHFSLRGLRINESRPHHIELELHPGQLSLTTWPAAWWWDTVETPSGIIFNPTAFDDPVEFWRLPCATCS